MSEAMINQAAWQHAPGHPLRICVSDLPPPAADEIRIRNAAIAINPIDWILQEIDLLPWLEYPAILGSDVAGEVAAVGSAVERFKVGDRVVGQAVGTTVNEPAQGAFQEHTIVLEHMAAPIPDDMAFADAAVLPLGLGTAASGLYGRTQLALAPPLHSPTTRPEVVLVWGGSSSVGCNAIQFAVASGYGCIAIASARNAGLLKALGAGEVLDHASPTIVEDVLEALRGRRLAGTLHATGGIDDCFAVVARSDGSRRVAATLTPPEERPMGIEATHIFGSSLKDGEVGPMIYRDFLPQALASRTFVSAPPAKVVGQGLAMLQPALEALRAGVSAAKVVVTLP
ncbi:zinc-binding alcohol dehydrogenase family protein [Brevundimonas naejangsanensis]|jgi:NADPH:quinone reductase-like Zn-dependent oxidoreductase|nr:zinc-binding alcohol dehydrogenase family protein [Brevundimonas diminuta]